MGNHISTHDTGAQNGISRRSFIGSLAIGGLVVLGGRAAAAPAPVRGGSLTILGQDIVSFDCTGYTGGNRSYFYQLYDTLIRLDAAGKPTPSLAESWKWSENGQVLTFKLRQGPRFHTGREITSGDVRFTVERYKDPAVGANLRVNIMQIVAVDTPDARTVVLKFERPYPGIFDPLDTFFIQNKDVIGEIKTRSAGSGPFVLVDWKPGEMFRLKRNDKYWKKDIPYLDEVILRVVKDYEAQIAMLEVGQGHMIKRLSGIQVQRLQNRPEFKIVASPLGANANYITMNVTRPPFDNRKIRQAIAYAIDRQRILDTCFPNGEGEVAYQPWTDDHWAYDPNLKPFEYNLDKTKQLLREAGFPKGFKTTLNASVPDYNPGSKESAQILQEDLKRAGTGVEIDIKVHEVVEARKALFEGNFDMAIHQYSAAKGDPSYNFPSITWGPYGPRNKAFQPFTSPEYERAVAAAYSEFDFEKRKRLYRDIARIVRDEAFVIPTTFIRHLFPTRKEVQGFFINLGGDMDFTRTWIDR